MIRASLERWVLSDKLRVSQFQELLKVRLLQSQFKVTLVDDTFAIIDWTLQMYCALIDVALKIVLETFFVEDMLTASQCKGLKVLSCLII